METKKLERWCEVIGRLKSLEVVDDKIYLEIGEYLIEIEKLPGFEEKLKEYMGRRIGLLHTDIPGREYLVRSAEAEDEAPREKERLLAGGW